MRIDLHCHTKQIKSGDGSGRNVTPEIFREKISNANVKIVAITNHNAFDYKQYLELKEAVKGICVVWPGIEIDITGSNGKKFHLIVVANPENAQIFANKIDAMYCGEDLETCSFPLRKVYDELNESDVIYIPHYHKTPSISEQDRDELLKIVGDSSRVFVELQDHRSLGVFANHDYNVLIGSDVKDWSKYEECTFADLRLPVESFSQFCMLAKRDAVVVNTLLNKKKTYSVTASPYKTVRFPLTLYADVNIIFGQKGTGKSEILTSLYDEMCGNGLSCVKYVGSTKDDDFNELTKTKDMSPDLSKLGIDPCEHDIELFHEWSDSTPTLFSKYVDWYKTKDNNANKSRMKITEARVIGSVKSPEYRQHSNDFKSVNEILKKIEKIDIQNYLGEDQKIFSELLSKLRSTIYSAFKQDIVEYQSAQLTDYSIERIKNFADKNSDTVSKPSSTGFREFAMRRLKLKESLSHIFDSLSTSEYNEQEYLGELEEKGKLYINKRYRMLCDESKTAEFREGIIALRDLKQLLERIREDVFGENVSSLLTDLSEKLKEMNISTISAFLGLSKQIVLSSGEEYKPSNGERGILLLQGVLSKEADAYFLDEPELGMGNSYIDTNIRPLISNLARCHKVVVVATHNANIAVRTLPYVSIFRVHENGQYTTYIGNPFNDCLVNITDDSDVKSWTEESMHTLEGGQEAFYERKSIYESKNN